MTERMYTWHYLCDTCSQKIKDFGGMCLCKHNWPCDRKLAINDTQEPEEVCGHWIPKGERK